MDWHPHGISHALKEAKSICGNLVNHGNWINFSTSQAMGSVQAASDHSTPHSVAKGSTND
eukprot:9123308-Ditylum_brightwellii.AAC.2